MGLKTTNLSLKHYVLTFILLSLAAFLFVFKITFNKIFGPQDTYTNPLYNQTITAIKYQFTPADNKTNYQLELKNNQWFYITTDSTLPADNNRINSLIDVLTTTPTLEIVSTNPQYLDRFNLDANTATTITFQANDQSITLYAGKIAPDFKSTYIAFDNRGPVLLFKNLDRFVLIPSDPILYYPFKEITLNPNNLISITATASGQTLFNLVFNQNQWLINDKPLPDTTKLQAYLDNLTNLKAQTVKPKNKINLNPKPAYLLKLKLKNRAFDVKIYQSPKQANIWLTTNLFPDYAWEITPVLKDDLIINPKDWLDNNPNQ